MIKNNKEVVKKVDKKRRALVIALCACGVLTAFNFATYMVARGTENAVYDDLRQTKEYRVYAEERIVEKLGQYTGKYKENQEQFLRNYTKDSYVDDKFIEENATEEQKNTIKSSRDMQIASGVGTALSGLGLSACVIGLVPDIKLDEEEKEM